MRPWLARLPHDRWPSLDELNALAAETGLTTLSGLPLRFVPPGSADPYYEVHVNETGRVHTRAQNWHDLLNALAWLAFPRTKARINAMHAAQIPLEGGRRSRLRDMLTLFDEGGAIVCCADPALEQMIRAHEWKDVFWTHRTRAQAALRVHVLGHAILEHSLAPWPGITCKVLFTAADDDPDAAAEKWLARCTGATTPADLVSLPIFGLPGWMTENDSPGFYADRRYFRPFRKEKVVRP